MISRFTFFALLVALSSAIVASEGLKSPIVASVIMAPSLLAASILVPSSLLARFAKVLNPLSIAILAAPILWMILQLVPIPVQGWGNSIWITASAALNEPLAERITVDIRATVLSLVQYSAVLATGLVAVIVALDRQRAADFLYVLLCIATGGAAISLLSWAMEFRNEFAPATEGGHVAAVLGTLLSCAVILRELDDARHRREPRPAFMPANWALPVALASLLVCLLTLVLRETPTIFIATLLGAELLLAIPIIRKWFLGIWGSTGVFAAATLIFVAFFTAIPAKKDTDLTIAIATQSQSATERMLQDIRLTGFGAGSFGSLLPIYRDIGVSSIRERPTDAASIAIDMGRIFFCGLLLVVAVTAWTLVKRSLSRGRDYLYPTLGAAAAVSVAVISFSTGGLTDLGPSLLLAGLFGLAFGRSLAGAGHETNCSPPQEPIDRKHLRSILPAQMGHRVLLVLLAVALLSQTIWLLADPRYSDEAIPVSAGHILRTVMPTASLSASAQEEQSGRWLVRRNFSAGDLVSTKSRVTASPSALHLLISQLHSSPLRGELWLLLAAASAETEKPRYDMAGLLKMSYYTAPNEVELFPLRLSLALSRDGLVRNAELRDLIKRDIEIVLTRQRTLEPALMAAYRSASAGGKVFAENLMSGLNASYAQQKKTD
ncbi:hypothetical protein [Bradyrhizobium sp. BR 10261]|uniref:hypothetical protein n=1 Tax=Bradyrhizobium sp. BR 10261 TaxID=2749992 RepID=UPI001C645681|nr:hypothetical protein [Bradyrhizobium sp. BR 10261]MBW7961882.1 hypothetical protein [Bradyrhizobium sp. BR 10261]